MEKKGNGATFGNREDSFAEENHSQLSPTNSQTTGTDKVKFSDKCHFFNKNIRLTPKVIEFIDAFEGKHFKTQISIQNVGKNPITVKIGEPKSFIFNLKKPSRNPMLLAAGSSIKGTVSYTYHTDYLVQSSKIPLNVNGCIIYYPIVVKTAQPEIQVEPQKLHFKVINLGATAKSLMLTIRNNGGIRTKFNVDVGKNLLGLVVSPMRGAIKAKESINIKVELMGLMEGEYYQELWIYTSDVPVRIPVLVEIVLPRLKISYPKGTEELTLVDFSPTFVGTRRLTSFTLMNFSAETTLYVILAEVKGELEILKNAKNTIEAFEMFIFGSEEGFLQPFENKILTVLFCPKAEVKNKGWRDEQKSDPVQREFTVFIRINRVHCLEWNELANIDIKPVSSLVMEDKDSIDYKRGSGNTRDGLLDNFPNPNTRPPGEEVLRVCLHGLGIEPDIEIQPSSFDFGYLNVGEKENKVLKITNHSILGVKCEFSKAPNVTITPKEMWLKSEKAHEFLLTLIPHSPGKYKTKIEVQIFAKSDVGFNKKKLEMIAVYEVNFRYNSVFPLVVPKPKICLGITPLITDAVGLQKDAITYKNTSELPFAAVLGLKHGFKPSWMKLEEDQLNNVDNAIVALPNDRPRYFATWPKEKICRTIFKGFFRYSPPEDLTCTFSPEERNSKKEHCTLWSNYIALLRKLRLEKSAIKNLKCHLEYDLSFKGSCKSGQFNLDLFLEPYHKNLEMRHKPSEHILKHALVPLSALNLIRISVQPKLINFGLVAVNTKAQELVTISNMNPFPISLKFTSGNSAVSVMNDGTFTVKPTSTKSVYIQFETETLGRYFGFLDYIINGSHEFKISIFALVNPKTLIIKCEDMAIEIGKYEAREPFQPMSMYLPLQNLIQAPVKYRWGFAEDSIYTTKIMEGEIPPRSELLTEILFDLNPKKSFYSEVKFTSENETSNLIKLLQSKKKVAVNFLNHELKMRDVPLNLPTKVHPVIRNSCYHDVVFELLNANPMPGVTIEPKRGIIKRRSSLALEITVQIPTVMKFSFEMVAMIQFINRISMKITGKVVLPNIRMKPSEVHMRKICVQSFDIFSLCMENAGTTPAEITIDLQSCPEFKIENNQSKLYLLPKKSSKLLIRFEPENAARYVFYLPVIINNILGPPSTQKQETELVSFYLSEFDEIYKNHGELLNSKMSEQKIPRVYINSTVTVSLLKISPLNLNFQIMCDFYSPSQNVEILNVFTSDVTFCVRNDDLGEVNNSPFNLKPIIPGSVEYRLKSIKNTLKPHEKLTLKATFEPKKPGSYSIEIPVFVRGYNDGFVYNFIRMSGEMKAPRIRPEISEIHFPPLPLNVGSDVTLEITAENYYNPDIIKCVICHSEREEYEEIQKCIRTEWLREPLIKVRDKNNSFPLRIKFESYFPVALRSHILLFDSTGGYATILVTAVADNSAITNYAFLNENASKYKIIRDPPAFQTSEPEEVISLYPVKKNDVKSLEKNHKVGKKTKSKSITHFSFDETNKNSSVMTVRSISDVPALPIDKGPRLVIQMTKSMSRPSELCFVNLHKKFVFDAETYDLTSQDQQNFTRSSIESQGSTTKNSAKLISSSNNVNPDFSSEENSWKYFSDTLAYVERWIFEVVLRCEQYLSIPQSFQRLKTTKPLPDQRKKGASKPSEAEPKDFFDFLTEVVETDRNMPGRPAINANDSEKQTLNNHMLFFGNILFYLNKNGCFLPHIRPEYLLDYENYSTYIKSSQNVDLFTWNNYEAKQKNSSKISVEQPFTKGPTAKEPDLEENSSVFLPRESWKKLLFEEVSLTSDIELEKAGEGTLETKETSKQHLEWPGELADRQFEHQLEVLDKSSFESRSTQAWLDVIIQIFKVFVLKKIIPTNTIPQVMAFELTEKLSTQSTNLRSVKNYGKKVKEDWILDVETFGSNIYCCQEKTLLNWLNDNVKIQKAGLWRSIDECLLKGKVVNNFDKDLSDSVALLSITASHCPYIVSTHFKGIFFKPDTSNKLQHNAGILIEAWRELEIGVTLETSDIVKPNPVFMIMLVTHLHEVLPTLHPQSLICFSAPLNSDGSRKIQVKNESDQQMFLKPKFFGEHEGFFNTTGPSIELKPSSVNSFNLTFTARKIKNVSAVLLLSGCAVSPNFAKSLAFYLEGEPSEIRFAEKFVFSIPLYKVICSEVPINPPFPDPTTYEVWYTTRKPELKETPVAENLFASWLKIWNRKLSRRLFLNKSEVEIQENAQATLSVTIACLTNEKRFFWLLLRSNVCDFVIQIEIKPKFIEANIVVNAFYSESWSPSATCICLGENTLPSKACPFLTELRIPMRNEDLWNALRTMFFKTLYPQEKSFWNKHFEMDIGLCLILWLLRPDEEEEVLEEFVDVLPTKVIYNLTIPSKCEYVILPSLIEIPDVRENADFVVPLHISNDAPPTFNFNLTMVSENGKEIRSLNVFLQPFVSESRETISQEDSKLINFLCQCFPKKSSDFCKGTNKCKN